LQKAVRERVGLFVNWLIGVHWGNWEGVGYGQYGYALVLFGVLVFFVNLKGNLDYRNAACTGTGDPLLKVEEAQ